VRSSSEILPMTKKAKHEHDYWCGVIVYTDSSSRVITEPSILPAIGGSSRKVWCHGITAANPEAPTIAAPTALTKNPSAAVPKSTPTTAIAIPVFQYLNSEMTDAIRANCVENPAASP
jgi:hypothetical protein